MHLGLLYLSKLVMVISQLQFCQHMFNLRLLCFVFFADVEIDFTRIILSVIIESL